MKLTPGNLTQHELIGLPVCVLDGSNPSLQGLAGTVVDETRNMLVIETATGAEKKLPKAGNQFCFIIPDGPRVRVKGERLIARPEDRIRKS
jgi:ribonuclease P protein subunit POP4